MVGKFVSTERGQTVDNYQYSKNKLKYFFNINQRFIEDFCEVSWSHVSFTARDWL